MFPGSGSGAPRPMNSWMHILRRLFRGSARGCGCDRARSRCGDARETRRRRLVDEPDPRLRAPSSASRRRQTLSFRLAAPPMARSRRCDSGLGRLTAARGAPAEDGNPAQRDVHVDALRVAGRRAPRDVHRELGRPAGSATRTARDPGRPREQAAARAVESRRRLPAAGAAQRSDRRDLPLGVRPPPHGCAHRPVALGAARSRGSRSGRPSSTETRSRCSTR